MAFASLVLRRALRRAGCVAPGSRSGGEVEGELAALLLGGRGRLVGEREQPIDWNKVLREMRAAGVRASGDELDEHDLEGLWDRAEGPYAPLAPPAAVVPLAEWLTAERPERTPERTRPRPRKCHRERGGAHLSPL